MHNTEDHHDPDLTPDRVLDYSHHDHPRAVRDAKRMLRDALLGYRPDIDYPDKDYEANSAHINAVVNCNLFLSGEIVAWINETTRGRGGGVSNLDPEVRGAMEDFKEAILEGDEEIILVAVNYLKRPIVAWLDEMTTREGAAS